MTDYGRPASARRPPALPTPIPHLACLAHAGADRLIVTHSAGGDTRDIGRLYVDRTTATWRLIEITLDPRARNRGTGTALLKWLIASARDARAAAVDLHVAHDNIGARRFYEKHGFRQTAMLSATHAHLKSALQPMRA